MTYAKSSFMLPEIQYSIISLPCYQHDHQEHRKHDRNPKPVGPRGPHLPWLGWKQLLPQNHPVPPSTSNSSQATPPVAITMAGLPGNLWKRPPLIRQTS
jgi:hypothetical protein